jgi:hypothetical protein
MIVSGTSGMSSSIRGGGGGKGTAILIGLKKADRPLNRAISIAMYVSYCLRSVFEVVEFTVALELPSKGETIDEIPIIPRTRSVAMERILMPRGPFSLEVSIIFDLSFSNLK